MKRILINKKYYSIPQTWDELTRKQLLQVMQILFLKNYRPEQLLMKLVQCLTGMSHAAFFRCNVEEIEEYFYLTEFLLTPKINFTKNLLPSYKFSHTEFFGPCDNLDNVRMKEFTLTEDLYLRWFDSEKKDMQALDELVAILYRPAPAHYDFKRNPEGDHREKFNQYVSAFYAKNYVSQWPQAVKLAIATWYGGCRLAIVDNNPEVFGGSGDPALYGLVSVMLNVAEGKVFGDFEKVEDQYINLVMMHLNETIDKGKKLEAQLKAK